MGEHASFVLYLATTEDWSLPSSFKWEERVRLDDYSMGHCGLPSSDGPDPTKIASLVVGVKKGLGSS